MVHYILSASTHRETLPPIPAAVETFRYAPDADGHPSPLGTTTNIGIACYVCEMLCDTIAGTAEPSAPAMIATALAHQIAREAVPMGNAHVWNWEKAPRRPDYHYPPDWDDTCKAIDALRSYERLTRKSLLALPQADLIEQLLDDCLYESKHCGEDVRLETKNPLSLYMFMASEDQKANNTEDILVTAVTLRTLTHHYPEVLRRRGSEIDALASKLCEVAQHGIKKRLPFCALSRCYFSWGLFLIILRDVASRLPKFQTEVQELVQCYLSLEMIDWLLPAKLKPHLWHDEYCYALRLACHSPNALCQTAKQASQIAAQTPIFYRHRRLDHFYGSPVWSELLIFQSHRNGGHK